MRLSLVAVSVVALLWLGCGRSESSGAPSPLAAGPADLDFGDVAVGAIAQRTLVVTNTGQHPLRVRGGDLPEPFAVKPASFALAPLETRTLTVAFRAREPVQYDRVLLRLQSEDLRGSPLEVPLRAAAKRPPELAVEPLHIAFGEVALASRGRATLTIANRGGLPLHVTHVGSPFPFHTDATDLVVEPLGRRAIEVSYAPDTAGEHRAQLLVRSDDPERSLAVVNLEGSGVETAPRPVIGTSAQELEFGRVSLGESRQQFLWIRNEGADPLALASLNADAPFSVSSRGRLVAPGKAVRVPVSFAPDQEGERLVPLTIHSNDPERPVLIVSLFGAGTRGPGSPPPGEVAVASDVAAGGAGAPSAAARDGGAPGPAANPSLPDDASSAEAAAAVDAPPPSPGQPLVGEGGYVYVGTLRSAISPANVAGWSFDASSGVLSVNGFAPPTVQYPFGQSFEFAPVDFSGVVSPSGDFSAPGTLTMINEAGTAMQIRGTFTTGDASYEANGTQATYNGSPLDAAGQGRIVFVGLGPDGTPAEKLPVVIEIPVARALPVAEAPTDAH